MSLKRILLFIVFANFLWESSFVRAKQELDPQAAALLEMIKEEAKTASESPQDDLDWVLASRKSYLAMIPLAGEPESVDRVYKKTINGPGGIIPLRIYDAAESSDGALVLYFHGGGFTSGGFETHDTPLRSLANRAETTVVAVGYRLAPEHPFPAALDDGYAALKWVFKNASEIGADPSKIIIAGDSAGGNLAAALALLSRDQQGPGIAMQLLIYPNTDLTPNRRHSSITEHDGKIITRDYIDRNIALYMGTKGQEKSAYASPLYAQNLAGLPPAYLITAGADPLRDEAELYAEKLRNAGIKTTHTRYPGMIHGFFQMAGVVDAARHAIDEAALAIKHVTPIK